MDTDPEVFAIIEGRRKPDLDAWNAGWRDHKRGLGFHQGPRPRDTVIALSWRIGWNSRALAMDGTEPPTKENNT